MKYNWVECGLPYDYEDHYNNYQLNIGPCPKLEDQAKEKFGFTSDEVHNAIYNISSECSYINAEIEKEIIAKKELSRTNNNTNEVELEKFIKNLYKEYENKFPVLKRSSDLRKLSKEIDAWISKQPEFIAWCAAYDDAKAKRKANNDIKSFSGLGLNKPGVLIEMESGHQYLIGDINPIRGTCNDCDEFESSEIVKRYAVVFEKKETYE